MHGIFSHILYWYILLTLHSLNRYKPYEGHNQEPSIFYRSGACFDLIAHKTQYAYQIQYYNILLFTIRSLSEKLTYSSTNIFTGSIPRILADEKKDATIAIIAVVVIVIVKKVRRR